MLPSISEQELDKLIRNNNLMRPDSVDKGILYGVGGMFMMMCFISLVAVKDILHERIVATQRHQLEHVMNTCPRNIISSELCNNLLDSRLIETPKIQNIVPICAESIPSISEAQWTESVCQLATSKPEMPNLQNACTFMQAYTQVMHEKVRDVCFSH